MKQFSIEQFNQSTAVQIAQRIAEQFEGRVVLTPHNSMTYVIHSVQFMQFPRDVTIDKLQFGSYFMQKYNLQVEHEDQPIFCLFAASASIAKCTDWISRAAQPIQMQLPTTVPTRVSKYPLLAPEMCRLVRWNYNIQSLLNYMQSILKHIISVNRHYALCTKFEKLFGFSFDDKILMRQAFTHKSYAIENQLHNSHYERLEFLGDAVLEIIVTHFLFEKFKIAREGQLSTLRIRLVNNMYLQRVGKQMQLLQFILFAEDQTQLLNARSIIADTFEALIGALFLDKGLPAARMACEQHLPLSSANHYLNRQRGFERYEYHSFEIPFMYDVECRYNL